MGTGDGWFGSAVSYLFHCPRTAEIEIRELPHFKSAHKPDRILEFASALFKGEISASVYRKYLR